MARTSPPDLARSRLRWLDGPPHPADHEAVEIPHVRGHPVDEAAPGDVARVREWPNRLGVREEIRDGDIVAWYPQLATRPSRGIVLALDLAGAPAEHGASTPGEDEIGHRTRWLRSLVRRLEQSPGYVTAAPIAAPCGIVLTPGVTASTVADARSWWPAFDTCPSRLGEFPGGIQLAITEAAWSRREAYAEAVTAIIERQG